MLAVFAPLLTVQMRYRAAAQAAGRSSLEEAALSRARARR